MPTDQVSLSQARRIALAAQGFSDSRPTGKIDKRHFRRVLDRLGLIQIDSVNVLVRSQELPLFARLGPHPRTMIDDACDRGELFEYWVHEASLVDTRHHHLYRWKMRRGLRWSAFEGLEERRPGFVDEVYRRVEDEGALVAGDLSERVGKKGSWWDWDDAKLALEALLMSGQVSARRRRSDFARVYDLSERMIPAAVLAVPDATEAEARKQWLELAATYLGIGTLDDLCDYHRQKLTPCKPLVAELVEEGVLREVNVEGWPKKAYVHRDARLPRRIEATALLSPFDPVVWYRPRAERLFDFHYRIEIYVPASKRVYGYFVLPVLVGEHLVGRLDLKADRQQGELQVRAAHHEPGHHPRQWAGQVADELQRMASWLGLDRVSVWPSGDAAPVLEDAVGSLSE